MKFSLSSLLFIIHELSYCSSDSVIYPCISMKLYHDDDTDPCQLIIIINILSSLNLASLHGAIPWYHVTFAMNVLRMQRISYLWSLKCWTSFYHSIFWCLLCWNGCYVCNRKWFMNVIDLCHENDVRLMSRFMKKMTRAQMSAVGPYSCCYYKLPGIVHCLFRS